MGKNEQSTFPIGSLMMQPLLYVMPDSI